MPATPIAIQDWSPRRLNHLIAARGYHHYLEIGVLRGMTFHAVQAPERIAVDPDFRFDWRTAAKTGAAEGRHYHPLTSDAYFSDPGADRPIDIAFIDGLHTFEQTLRDLLNVLTRLRPGGAVLIDDTVPNNAASAMRTPEEARAARAALGLCGLAWHGDVYKVVVFLNDYLPGYDFVTFVARGSSQTLLWRGTGKARLPLTSRMGEIDAMDFTTFSSLRPRMPEAREEDGLARCLSALAAARPV